MRKHFVRFLSPGTLFAESTTKPIESWDTQTACEMAKWVIERHDARPCAFVFSTMLTHDPVPDGEGGFLEVKSKVVAESGTYFLGGSFRSYKSMCENIQEWDDEKILRSNMLCNGWAFIVENCNSYKFTRPFEPNAVIVNQETGEIVVRGDDPELMAYRKEFDIMRAKR